MDKNVFSLLVSVLFFSTFLHATSGQVTLKFVNDLLVVTNSTAKVAMVIEADIKLYALFNGDSGSAYLVHAKYEEKTSVPDGVWKADDSSLEDALKSLKKGLNDISKKDGAKDGISDPDDVAKIVAALIMAIDQDILRNPEDALNLVDTIAKDINNLLLQPLYGLQYHLQGEITLPIDLAGTTNTLRGLGLINTGLRETTRSLAYKGRLHLKEVLEAKDGIQALTAIINDIGSDTDLSPLSKFSGGPDGWFYLISELGGHLPIGVNGIFQVLYELARYSKNSKTIVDLQNDLIKFVTKTPSDALDTLQDDLNKGLNDLLDAIDKANATDGLKNLVDPINEILNKNLTFEKRDLSKAIGLLANDLKDTKPFLIVLKVLLSIDSVIPANQTITKLLTVLIAKLDSVFGIELEKLLSIPLDIDVDSIEGSILKSVLSSAGDLKKLKDNVYDGLADLKVIKDIVKALKDNLKDVDDSLDLKDLLDQNTSEQDVIKALVQSVSGEDLEASSLNLRYADINIKNCATLPYLTHVKD